MYRFHGFDDSAYFGALEEDTIPIHYLHDQDDIHDTNSSSDPIAAYWRSYLRQHGRSRASGSSGVPRGGNKYPPSHLQDPRNWPAGQHPLFHRPGNQVAGNGLWTHTDPPHWGPMYSHTMPLRKYVSEVNLWEKGTSIEHPRRIALLIANLHGTARSYIETLMLQPINHEQMTYGATNQRTVSGQWPDNHVLVAHAHIW